MQHPRAGRSRPGFTIVEALVAVTILVTGLGAMAGLSISMTRKARTPDDLGKAAWLATERMNYFRAQGGFRAAGDNGVGAVSGFVAAGGTYYPPPVDPRLASQDKNLMPEYHNTAFNRRPTLLVREYLYDTAEVAKAVIGGDVSGDLARRRAYQPGQRFAINEVPTTPARFVRPGAPVAASVTRVIPNPENEGTAPAHVTHPDGSVALPAPRANDNLRGPNFDLSNRALRFVREVWVQPMHPMFQPATPWNPPANAPNYLPAPPYGVVVTVRVYLKDPRVRTYTTATPRNETEGLGPDFKRLLAEMVGVVGIQ